MTATTEVLFDARVEINSVVLSDCFNKTSLEFEADEQDATTFGSEWKVRKGGLKDVTVGFDGFNDFADNGLDELLWPLLGTVVPVKVRKDSDAIGVTNPEYSGSVLVNSIKPLDVSVGEISQQSLSWPGSGTWARAVA